MNFNLSENEIYKYRAKPFYYLTTDKEEELTYQKVYESLTELKECGFGGFVLFNKPPHGFNKDNYLTKHWFDMVKNFAKAAKELSLEMYINNGFDYPPGAVAGKVKEIAPDLHPLRIVLEDGKPQVKKVEWGFPAFEVEESAKIFTELVYESYKREVGEFFGDPIKGFFADTDNRRVNEHVMFVENHPMEDYFPWAENFEESFKKEYDYDIMPFMPQILKRESIKEARDYWEHSGRMYSRWFKKNREWLNKNGLIMIGHAGDTPPYLYKDAPRASCFTEGRFLDVASGFDYAGTDHELLCLDGGIHFRKETFVMPSVLYGNEIESKIPNFTDMTKDMRAKQASSAAFIQGKKGAVCEMFAASNFDICPDDLKRISSFQIMHGINLIVPSAFHYRFRGTTKYFAPPELSKKGMAGEFIKELNDLMAQNVAMMSQGKAIYPVALLDPTDSVWMNIFEKDEYFSVFAKLNRLPYGFVVCDAKNLLEKDFGFKVVIYAGFAPEKELIEKLENKGIKVISANEIEKLSEFIPLDIRYEGEGTPHFARREIEGEEFLFIANIEGEAPVKGKIYAYGRDKEIKLYPGDIFYISENYDNIPEIENEGKFISNIPEIVKVKFDRPNVLPLEYFKNEKGEVVNKSEGKFFVSKFNYEEGAGDICLFVPQLAEVTLNDKKLSYENKNVYDDVYFAYNLNNVNIGENELIIKTDALFDHYDRIFIEGNFDVDVKTSDKKLKDAFAFYNLRVCLPSDVNITLKKRRDILSTNKSWALQGQGFYSGKVSYEFALNIPENGSYRLYLPEVKDAVKLYIDGEFKDKKVFAPFSFYFTAEKGLRNIILTVSNSLGNQMECYLEKSGITNGAILEKL